MTSKNVLNKILSLLSKEEVVLTYAKLADGTIVESATFDVGEDLFVVSEDGTKSPAPNGFHDLMLKDSEGNETLLKVKSEDGKIVERENVEMADVKTEPIPQGTGEELPENVRPEQPNSVKSGTLKMAEEDEEVEPIPADEDKSMEEEGEEPEIEIELGKKMEEMQYRIEEMEKKMAKMEAMYPPVASEVIQEEEGIKMSAEPDEEEEELPKLDGAPIEEGVSRFSAQNKSNYGKKVNTPQSSFLSKLYN
jgi:hypothetical protein